MSRTRGFVPTFLTADASSYTYRLIDILTSDKRNETSSNKLNNITEESISTHSWLWQGTQYTNRSIIHPADSALFVASFSVDGQFSPTTDCNNIFGNYTLNSDSISFGPLASTKEACTPESKETEYIQMISKVTHYSINESGNLNLTLQDNTGSMVFIPQETTESTKATDYNSSRSNRTTS